MSHGPLHLNTLLHNILTILKRSDEEISFEKLSSIFKLDLKNTPEVYKRLKNNPRIICSETHLKYRPPYEIRNLDELTLNLKSLSNSQGILESELKESFKHYDKQAGSAAFIKLSLNDDNVLYWNEYPQFHLVDYDIRSLWDSISFDKFAE